MILLIGFERNLDDNAEAPMFVRSRRKTMCRTIGLHQSVLDVRQANAGRLGIDRSATWPRSTIGNFDPHCSALTLSGNPDVCAMFRRSDRIFDRILDQRLEQQ